VTSLTQATPKTDSVLSELRDALRGRLDCLVICLSQSWGGLEQVAAQDALEVATQGLRIRLLCLEGSPIHEHFSNEKRVELIPIQYRPRNFLDLRLRSEINRLIRDGVTLIHMHQPSLLGSVVPWLWPYRGVPLLVSRHVMSNHVKKSFFHHAMYRRVDALMAMSQTLRRNILETHAVRERKVKVVHLGLDFERFDPDLVNADAQRKTWGADSDTIVVGLVGRIDPAKGQGTFIKAAAGLMKNLRVSEKIRFVIVGEETLGSTSDYLSELRAMVAQFRLEDQVIFAGFQENIPEIMRAFDVFVMPSRQEAFGLVAIEAMAMECPIVISRGGSAEEIVGNEEFGLTVRPEDAFDLQKKLRWLIDNPLERIKMGQRARSHVMVHYDRKTRVRKTLEIYDWALRRRSGFH
jgi:glycosyltransferase involved in cell wall biosynthesis